MKDTSGSRGYIYKKDGINDCDQTCATHVLHHEDGHYVSYRLARDYGRSRRLLKFSGFGDESSRNFAIFLLQRADSISNTQALGSYHTPTPPRETIKIAQTDITRVPKLCLSSTAT